MFPFVNNDVSCYYHCWIATFGNWNRPLGETWVCMCTGYEAFLVLLIDFRGFGWSKEEECYGNSICMQTNFLVSLLDAECLNFLLDVLTFLELIWHKIALNERY